MIGIIVACVILFVVVTIYYAQSEKPVKNALIGMGSGIASLFAASFLLPVFQLSLPINIMNVFVSLILGIPGVAMSAIFHVLFV